MSVSREEGPDLARHLDAMICRAIDRDDAEAADLASSILRSRGNTYPQIFERAKRLRSALTVADWDALIREAGEDAR